MELHQLRYFCAVADTGSFSVPRKKCHVSQPSLSQQILKLESELGGRLFDRLGRSSASRTWRSVSPSRPLCSPRTLQRQRRAHRAPAIGSRASRYRRHPTIAPYWLASRLATFSRKFPKVHLTIAEEITPVLLERLRAGSVDLAVLALRSAAMNSIPTRFSHRAPLCRAAQNSQARPAPHLATRRSSPRSISFSSRRPLLSRYRRRRLRSRPPRSPRRLRKRHLSSLLAMVGAGMGVLLVPEMAVDKSRPCRFVPHRGHPSRTRHRRRSATAAAR